MNVNNPHEGKIWREKIMSAYLCVICGDMTIDYSGIDRNSTTFPGRLNFWCPECNDFTRHEPAHIEKENNEN